MAAIAHARHSAQVTTASGLDIIAGLWLIVSPFFLAYGNLPRAMANDVILGIIIGILALIRFTGAFREGWISWINLLLGIWVLISPWALGYASQSVAMRNNVILGIIVILLSGWSALATDTADAADLDMPSDGKLA